MEQRKMIPGKHLGKGAVSVDMKIGKETPLKNTMMMLPAAPGKCSECATEHPDENPHNASSLFYQYKFYNEHGRWPNWVDAMKHCSPEVREKWTKALEDHGIDVKGGALSPGMKK